MRADDRTQPHDVCTEDAVLGTLIMYSGRLAAYPTLTDSDFYYRKEQAAFRCLSGVVAEGKVPNVGALTEWALSNGEQIEAADFREIIQCESEMTLDQDVRRLLSYSHRRKAWVMLQEAASQVLDLTTDIDSDLADMAGRLQAMHTPAGSSIADFGDAVAELDTIIRDNLDGKRNFLRTGFRLLDSKFVLRPGTLTVIAAFTSVGKTSLAMNIAVNVAEGGEPAAYYSLEMGKAELAARVMSEPCKIPSGILMNTPLRRDEYAAYMSEADKRRSMPLYIDESNTSDFDRTVQSVRQLVRTRGIRLAVIDYLQIYAQKADNTEASLSYMARAAKNVARECGIAVILLSQLNRSASHPSIRMLRGSGQIEESADNVLLIDRPEAYPDEGAKYEGEFAGMTTKGTAKLILAKGRGTGTGCSLVGFNAPFTRFFDLQQEDGEEPRPF